MIAPPLAATDFGVRAHKLRKTYNRGRVVAVDGLDLSIPLGGVHGFLGPNGSGKTTTLRMMLGLIRPDSGTVEVLGAQVPAGLSDVASRIGAIVEQPRFFPTMSARKNLALLAEAVGTPIGRVGAVLEHVGLSGRAKDEVRTFSLGMKQRLAVAATLLKDPELLIFDEPTNGLDPAGIHEIRTTMRNLGNSGKTVIVSSHLLAEVEQIADTVSIIARGRLVREGRVADILRTGPQTVRLVIADREAAAQTLASAGFVVSALDGAALRIGRPDSPVDPVEVARALGHADLWPSALNVAVENLEEVFLGLTAGEDLTSSQSNGIAARRALKDGVA